MSTHGDRRGMEALSCRSAFDRNTCLVGFLHPFLSPCPMLDFENVLLCDRIHFVPRNNDLKFRRFDGPGPHLSMPAEPTVEARHEPGELEISLSGCSFVVTRRKHASRRNLATESHAGRRVSPAKSPSAIQQRDAGQAYHMELTGHPERWEFASLVQESLPEGKCAMSGCEQDILLANRLISMYGERGALQHARSLFDSLRRRDVVTWNAMIAAYARHGCSKNALQLARDMEKEGMKLNEITFICTLRACADLSDIEGGKIIHACVVDSGFESDIVVGTAIVSMYGKCGALGSARASFYKMHPCNTITWNAMIAAYSQHGHGRQAIQHFYEMKQRGVEPDKITFVSVVSACASLEDLSEGCVIHACVCDGGFESDVIVGNALVNMYGKCGAKENARAMFQKMQRHDVGSWNTVISAYAQDLDGKNALKLFEHMQQEGVKPNNVTILSVLCACESLAALAETKLIHAYIVDTGLELEVMVCTSLLNTYGKCGALETACLLFGKMSQPCLVSWNALIAVCSQQGHSKDALELFQQLQQQGLEPDSVTFISVLTACANLGALENGKVLHAQIVDDGCEYDVIVGNALISMYGKCGAVDDAHAQFEKMHQHSEASWNAIMGARVQLGHWKDVLQILRQMQEEGFKPDKVSYLNALGGCAGLSALTDGILIHALIVENGSKSEVLENALVHMYGKCCAFEDAHRVFCNMHRRTIGSWNAMIAVWAQHEKLQEALLLFKKMQQMDVSPDNITFTIVLGACASLVDLVEGRVIHTCIADCGYETDTLVGTALMNMYGKCGALKDARHVFDRMHERDVAAWNAMISVYSQQGHGKKAVHLFEEMLEAHVKPDDITFVNLLSSCSHAGLVDEGQHYFDSMIEDHGIIPTTAHYGCMIDLFGRAGQLAEAQNLIYNRSLELDVLVWTNLLGVCRIHGDMERGRRAAEHLLQLEQHHSATYVLLSDIYATDGRWDDEGKVKHANEEYTEGASLQLI